MDPIAAFFDGLGGWTWWIIAAILFLAELLAPGVFFLWLGMAAIVVALSTLLVDTPWQWQIASFAVLSVVSVVLSRIYFSRSSDDSDQPMLNRRADKLVGREFVLADPIVGGQGRIKVDDTLWRVEGPDSPAGIRVRVSGADGSTLRVLVVDGG